MKTVLAVASVVEVLTGVALVIAPEVVARLLLGGDLNAVGVAVARVAGAALLALGLACWPSPGAPGRGPAAAAMLTYNLLVTAYLAYLGASAEGAGVLLWPAAAFHAVM